MKKYIGCKMIEAEPCKAWKNTDNNKIYCNEVHNLQAHQEYMEHISEKDWLWYFAILYAQRTIDDLPDFQCLFVCKIREEAKIHYDQRQKIQIK